MCNKCLENMKKFLTLSASCIVANHNQEKAETELGQVEGESGAERQWQLERKYTMNEVQRHSQLDDCWMVIFDKVYNITEFVDEHPGGDFILLEYAGRDATHPFLSSRHGSSAYKMLDKYWIGILVDEELYYSNNSSYCSVYSNLSWRSTPTMKDSSSEAGTDAECSACDAKSRLSPPSGRQETGNRTERTSGALTSAFKHHQQQIDQSQEQEQPRRSQRHECNTCNSSSACQARSEAG